MKDEQRFVQAVQLAAAFVANGDIRLNKSGPLSESAERMLADLIPDLYDALQRAEHRIDESNA